MALSLFTHWWNKREAFRRCFRGEEWTDADGRPTVHAERVLADLREFCRANETCVVFAKDGHYDTHATAVAEGRREVLLRIQALLGLTDETLLKMRDPDETDTDQE